MSGVSPARRPQSACEGGGRSAGGFVRPAGGFVRRSLSLVWLSDLTWRVGLSVGLKLVFLHFGGRRAECGSACGRHPLRVGEPGLLLAVRFPVPALAPRPSDALAPARPETWNVHLHAQGRVFDITSLLVRLQDVSAAWTLQNLCARPCGGLRNPRPGPDPGVPGSRAPPLGGPSQQMTT